MDIKTVEGLTKYAREFLLDNYDLELEIPININYRLTASYGLFKYNKNGSKSIEIAKTLVDFGKNEYILSTLKHECIHYALYELDLPYKDGDDYFESELIKHNALKNNEKVKYPIGYIYKDECKECSKVYTSYRKLNLSKYKCKCGGALKHKTKETSNGDEIIYVEEM